MAEFYNYSDEIRIFMLVCKALDKRGWIYAKSEANLYVKFQLTASGSVTNTITIRVDKKRKLVEFVAEAPYTVDYKKFGHMAVAICTLNYKFADGRFDLDLDTGLVHYVLPISYRTMTVNEDFVDYIIKCSCFALEKCSADLRDVSNGKITADYFINNQ